MKRDRGRGRTEGRRGDVALVVAAFLSLPAGSATAQDVVGGDPLTTEGIYRASAIVDSVFVDRTAPESVVEGGDFASYLMARLGIFPIPPDLRFRVVVDTAAIVLGGRVQDLPADARRELGPLVSMVRVSTPVRATVRLYPAGSRAVRFHLASVELGGVTVPEPFLQSVMYQVGARYPALTKTGRDLLVEIPRDGRIALVAGGVRLVGPGQETVGSSP